jgi:putative FmdB family regulatory protein
MPIYEYRCEKCGEFEHTQRITDAALQRCPTCKRKVRRLISSTSFQLKGSGWYVTDYARAGKDKEKKDGRADGGGESTPSGAASDGAKSDAGGSADAKSDSSKADSAAAKPAKPDSKPDSKKRARASA